MPCGPTYKCQLSSYEATLTFLALGGRHTDSADSYTDAEPGIGLAMREWIAADPANNQRSELFIASKIGPGGACWPLGYNESIAQAKMIIGYYNQLPSPMPTTNITQLDLLLIHWPVNFGPCSIGKLPGIPTTDPLCNGTLPSYDEKACRISTWRGMVAAMQMGLTRSIGVSNFNSTEMQDLKDAGLPLPAANQISWSPGIVPKLFGPYSHTETSKSLQAWYVCITITHTAAAASAFFKQENKASSILPSSTQDRDQKQLRALWTGPQVRQEQRSGERLQPLRWQRSRRSDVQQPVDPGCGSRAQRQPCTGRAPLERAAEHPGDSHGDRPGLPG